MLGAAVLVRGAPDADMRAMEQEIFRRVNEQRRREGVPELAWNEDLAKEARRHSYNMVARWFFAHEDPARGSLSRRLRASRISWRRCAENLFTEKGYPDLAQKAVEGWWNSPGHRTNMLDRRLTRTGIGIAVRVDDTFFVTQEFIAP